MVVVVVVVVWCGWVLMGRAGPRCRSRGRGAESRRGRRSGWSCWSPPAIPQPTSKTYGKHRLPVRPRGGAGCGMPCHATTYHAVPCHFVSSHVTACHVRPRGEEVRRRGDGRTEIPRERIDERCTHNPRAAARTRTPRCSAPCLRELEAPEKRPTPLVLWRRSAFVRARARARPARVVLPRRKPGRRRAVPSLRWKVRPSAGRPDQHARHPGVDRAEHGAFGVALADPRRRRRGARRVRCRRRR